VLRAVAGSGSGLGGIAEIARKTAKPANRVRNAGNPPTVAIIAIAHLSDALKMPSAVSGVQINRIGDRRVGLEREKGRIGYATDLAYWNVGSLYDSRV